MPDDFSPIERKSLSESAIRIIVRETVTETLGRFGFDAERATELQADLYHLRRLRRCIEESCRTFRRTLFGIIATALIGLIWEALKRKLHDG